MTDPAASAAGESPSSPAWHRPDGHGPEQQQQPHHDETVSRLDNSSSRRSMSRLPTTITPGAGAPTTTTINTPTLGQGGHSSSSSSSSPSPFHSSLASPGVFGQARDVLRPLVGRATECIRTFASFIGPGFLIAVAYIDPGNYSTGIAAGATYQFKLLFIVLVANLFAIFLQILCIKLGSVSGLNLAQACRKFLPRWLSYGLYFFAEVAIMATDVAEVIGFAIGLNLLIPELPLVAGCAISIVDVFLILLFYRPNGPMKGLRIFEYMISALVLAVVICFCIQLSFIKGTSIRAVFRGYAPSKAVTETQGLYQACGILGATVMPHSLYLGSGIVQPRLKEYDRKHNLLPPGYVDEEDDEKDNNVAANHPPHPRPSSSSSSVDDDDDNESPSNKIHYTPSPASIRHSYRVSALELALALFSFALFVNSSIVIVSGASNLYPTPPDSPTPDIFSLHDLLSRTISPGAGIIFALALLLSGVSAGVVCTVSGQMISEGALNWRMRPWVRRLVTRSLSIVPSIVIAGAVGRDGLNVVLNASQVVLSVVLPFVTAPLIYFTCRDRYMTVSPSSPRGRDDGGGGLTIQGESNNDDAGREEDLDPPARDGDGHQHGDGDSSKPVSMANSWYTATFAVLLWLIITVLNVANLVLLDTGSA